MLVFRHGERVVLLELYWPHIGKHARAGEFAAEGPQVRRVMRHPNVPTVAVMPHVDRGGGFWIDPCRTVLHPCWPGVIMLDRTARRCGRRDGVPRRDQRARDDRDTDHGNGSSPPSPHACHRPPDYFCAAPDSECVAVAREVGPARTFDEVIVQRRKRKRAMWYARAVRWTQTLALRSYGACSP